MRSVPRVTILNVTVTFSSAVAVNTCPVGDAAGRSSTPAGSGDSFVLDDEDDRSMTSADLAIFGRGRGDASSLRREAATGW